MSGNSDFKDIVSTRAQDVQQLSWLLSDINPPRRSESAPPFLVDIFQYSRSSSAAGHTQEGALGRSNLGVSQQLSGPWDTLPWGRIPKHRSLDSRYLESLAEESDTHSFFSALTEEAQTPSSLSPFTSDPLATRPLQGGFTHPQRRGMGVQEPTTNSNAHPPGTPSTSAGDSSMNHADVPGRIASLSASPQRQGLDMDSPALHQHSSPLDSHLNASEQSQGPPTHSRPQSAPHEGGNDSDSSPHAQLAAQHAQHAGQGSAAHSRHQRRQGLHQSAHSYQQPYQQHAMGQQRVGTEGGWYPPYGQPPPPPPMAQQQRPSMQWHAGLGRPLPHEGISSHANMGSRLPPQAQAMGVGPMGLYPGVMPYGMVPQAGMHHQGGMQQPMYMHNGYMMTYYPPIPTENMPMYNIENGTSGSLANTNFPQSAPFPPALDPHYAEYMQHMSQQQVFPGAPLSTLTHMESASKTGKEATSQSSSSKGPGLQHMRNANGFHRRTPSGISTASSTFSGDRDRNSRRVQDRRGDAATATSSSAGLRTRGSDDTSATAADAVHVAQAAALLEEFKTKSKPQGFELKDIKGFIYEFCRDQHGSRFIQQKLADAPPEELMAVYQEVEPHVIALMQDVFGNYVIQKCFEHGTKEVLELLAEVIKGHVLALSLQMYGCRVIQKALEVLQLEQQRVIVHELQGQVMRCVRDQNGNHVIQKSIERVKPTTEIHSIIEDIKGSVVGLSTHPYGCRVVQRVLEHCTLEDVKAFIRRQILFSTLPLATDQYGNYVIQHMLEHGPDSARQEIIEKLLGQVERLSQHKFASNVIEKCLQCGDPAGRQALIQEVVGDPQGAPPDSDPLQMMTKDQYANYVVQKMLEVCDDSQRQLLMARITTHVNQLKKLTYGKHIVARVEKLLVAGNAAAVQQEAEAKSAASIEGAAGNADASAISGIAEHEATTVEMNNALYSAKSEEELGDDDS